MKLQPAGSESEKRNVMLDLYYNAKKLFVPVFES